ncbi:unnamed protein product, partial [marine sediment metagenome]
GQKGDELKRTGCYPKALSFKTVFWQLTQKSPFEANGTG